jgi:hypothetical protein
VDLWSVICARLHAERKMWWHIGTHFACTWEMKGTAPV